MKILSKYLLGALVVALLATCKREDAQWDVGIVSPVATASLTMEDMIPGDYIVANTDSSLRIVYQNTIYTFPIDSLLKIPDTTFAYPLVWPLTVPIPPNTQVPLTLNPLVFNINPAKLTRVVINSGSMRLKAVSTVDSDVTFNYKIPKATKNWAPFDVWGTIAAALNLDSSYYDQTYDLAGYDIALNGNNGGQFNILPYNLTVQTGADTAHVSAGQLIFKLNNSFIGMKPEFVEGYFGSQSNNYGPDTIGFNFMKNIIAGTLNLEDINLDVTLENSIGADIRANIKSLKGRNTKTGNTVALQHPLINSPMNVDRAVNYGYNPASSSPTYSSTQKTFTFNNGNSNLAAFVSNLPDELEYKVDLTLNPLGNISGGKDFIYRDAGIKVNINLDLPLTFKSTGLTLLDTIDYNVNAKQEDVDRYQGGSFKLFANNGFPIDATVQLLLVDENNVVTDTLLATSLIAAAPVDANFKAIGQQQTIISFPVGVAKANALVNTKKVIVRAVFDTKPMGQFLKMYSTYKLDLKLTSDFKFRMKL